MFYADIDNGKFNGFYDQKPSGEYVELTDEEHHKLYSEYCITPCASFDLKDGKIVIGNNGEVTTPEMVRANLLSEADAVIRPMLGYAVAGILSDAEKERFKAWNEYRKALEGLDVTADEIEWPDKPE